MYKSEQGHKRWRSLNPKKRLLYSTKQSAKNKRLEHTITEEDITIPEVCPYLNIKLQTDGSETYKNSNASVDRIDNTKGYTPDNIEIISYKANKMKQDASIEELKQFARGVLNRWPD